jgi:hypothetical protein
VEITGFVDEAADFAGRLGDVDQQRVPATGNVICALPTQLSNYSKLDTRSTMGGQEPGNHEVMRMQLQRRPSGLPDWL